MKKIAIALLLAHASLLAFVLNAQPPATKKTPVTDTYFGKAVTDNYLWLEDMNNKEVQDWFKSQHDYTTAWLDNIPGRDALFEDFKKLDALKRANINGIKIG